MVAGNGPWLDGSEYVMSTGRRAGNFLGQQLNQWVNNWDCRKDIGPQVSVCSDVFHNHGSRNEGHLLL